MENGQRTKQLTERELQRLLNTGKAASGPEQQPGEGKREGRRGATSNTMETWETGKTKLCEGPRRGGLQEKGALTPSAGTFLQHL